jgi:CHASE2 domain-containing sensor protein
MTASILCAIHCAIVPIILTSLPLFGLGFLANPLIEWTMISLALVIGIYAIGLSYVRTHHRPLPMILLIAGFLVIIGGHLFVTNWREAIIVPIGGLLIATAHFFNFRYTGLCREEHKRVQLIHRHQPLKAVLVEE